MWAAYGIFQNGMGKIVGEDSKSYDIISSEHDYDCPETWSKKYTRKFETPEELVKHVCSASDEFKEVLWERLQENFPKALKNKKILFDDWDLK